MKMCDLSVHFVTLLYNTVRETYDSIKLSKYEKHLFGDSGRCFFMSKIEGGAFYAQNYCKAIALN